MPICNYGNLGNNRHRKIIGSNKKKSKITGFRIYACLETDYKFYNPADLNFAIKLE